MDPTPNRVFKTINEIQLKEIKRCIIQFSADGSLFGIYNYEK